MVIKFKGEDLELKFSFNSFKYMREFDMSALQNIEDKPFEIIPMLEMLLLGSMNNKKKKKFSMFDVEEFLEEYMEENAILTLLGGLMDLLQESSFFKSRHREVPKE